jgi:hypothetical protein
VPTSALVQLAKKMVPFYCSMASSSRRGNEPCGWVESVRLCKSLRYLSVPLSFVNVFALRRRHFSTRRPLEEAHGDAATIGYKVGTVL